MERQEKKNRVKKNYWREEYKQGITGNQFETLVEAYNNTENSSGENFKQKEI